MNFWDRRMDYSSINQVLREQGIYVDFETLISPSFFLNGKDESMVSQLIKMIFRGLCERKEEFLTLLILCILFGVVSQLTTAFGRKYFGEYGYYIYFICCASICIKLFMECFVLVEQTIQTILHFMEALLPIFCTSILMADGMKTASGIYAMVLGVVLVAQLVLCKICLPCGKILMSIHFANACTGENLLSKLGQLIFDGTNFIMKGMLGVVCGMSVIKTLILPGQDRLIRGGIGKAMEVIPGLGSLTGACTQVILGTSKMIKNGIGAGGLFVLFLLMVVPLVTILSYLIGFRILEALMQPIAKERMIDMFGGCAQSITLLVRILIYTFSFLFLSLSLITMLS